MTVKKRLLLMALGLKIFFIGWLIGGGLGGIIGGIGLVLLLCFAAY